MFSYHDRMPPSVCAVFELSLLLVGCQGAEPPVANALVASSQSSVHAWAEKQPPVKGDAAQTVAAFVETSNAFGFKLFSAADVKGSNALMSPASVSMALGMLANGAKGSTQGQILSTLGVADLKTLTDSTHSLMVTLHQPKDSPISISNGVWMVGRQPLTPLPAFVSTIENDFGGRVTSTSLLGKQGADVINKWVGNATGGLIGHVLDEIDPLDHSVLVNATAFKAEWQTEFDPKETQPSTFTKADGKTVQVPFMSLSKHDMQNGQDQNGQYLLLPYKQSGYEMVLILPAHGTPEDFLAKQSTKSWEDMLSSLRSNRCVVAIPKWTFRNPYDLKPILSKLGMANLFGEGDFSGIAEGMDKDFISRATHDTFIQVDEKGTKAAAVTAVTVTSKAIMMGVEFRADRPFAFAILHRPTQSILFLGVCNDPSAN